MRLAPVIVLLMGAIWITLSDRRDATYRVRVVQKLLDNRFRRPVEVAGESRAIAGFGGQGAVSFFYLASGAVTFASDQADRASIVEAIGKGVGRAAVHEFTHQLLPRAAIHSTNIRSYEYAYAARSEQYFGAVGPRVAAAASSYRKLTVPMTPPPGRASLG